MSSLNRHLAIQLGAMLASLGLALAALVHSSSGHFQADRSMAWACAPYLAFAVLAAYGRAIDPTLKTAVAFTETAILILAFSALVYTDGIYFDTSSTSPLIFLFAPLWIYGGAIIVFLGSRGMGGFVNALRRRAT